TIDTDTLRPSALAAIAAALSMEAAEWDGIEDESVAAFEEAAQACASTLIEIVGKDDALAMLMESGAHPDYLNL
nr:hypothetical protein [Thiobacillaceae bacterium]